MKKIITLIVLLLSGLLASCVYVDLPETTDPAVKLQDARNYMAQRQPLPAERMILEAIQIYESRNEPENLGHAYRDFGAFLRSPVLAEREQTYRQVGFLEESVTYDNRMEKSDEYFARALAQYQEAAARYQRENRFDRLSTLYYRQAQLHLLQGNNSLACSAYDQSRAAYAESTVRNPSTRPAIPRGYSSFHEAIETSKQKAGC